jgi:aspartyl-tRNA(Asn)/glutamyl-tRNA(Gln) amidotransferase subunit C
MSLTIEEVRHIADLARLRLTPEEEQRFAGQLSAILDYAERLRSVDTGAIPPTASVLPLHAPLRPDNPRQSPASAAILHNAPASQDGMFRIPAVFDQDGEAPQRPPDP